jgi:hypothetical protein
MYNGMIFNIFSGKTVLYGYYMSCHFRWYVEHESYGLTKLKDPHMIGLNPQKVKEVKVLAKKKLFK